MIKVLTNEEIIHKAIEKAIKNGYKYFRDSIDDLDFTDCHYYEIIFSHNFAEAFWGEAKNIFQTLSQYTGTKKTGYTCKFLFLWQYHLQQMVLETEPLKYLSRFLDE